MTQFIKVEVPVDSASARKQKEIANHLATFCDNKKLQARGLRVKSISIAYEEVKK